MQPSRRSLAVHSIDQGRLCMMDAQFYTPYIRKDAGAGGADSHPYQCYKAHGGNRAYLVKMVLAATEASVSGAQESTTISASSNKFFPQE